MNLKVKESFKKIFKGKASNEKGTEESLLRVNVKTMEKKYEENDFTGAAIVLRNLLEIYGTQKKKNHRLKGREFIEFILSNKHKDLKAIGYTHWQNIVKLIHLDHEKPYPYHKQNLRNAMDFFEKELKSIRSIDMVI